MEHTALITEGEIITRYGNRVLRGFIFGDTKERFFNGTLIYSSKIIEGKRGDEYIVTRNSVYKVDWKVEEPKFAVGDLVSKVGGDYSFDGVVVSVFKKLSGVIRLVVEDDRGILHVYSEKNLKHSEIPPNEKEIT